ncbi:hypothetical protein NL676_010684 [Syzygium grande]|nr:hypothetical protein NL676_010684 [Syzygium grande]
MEGVNVAEGSRCSENGENFRHPTIRRINFAKEMSIRSLERPHSQSSRLSAGTFALHTLNSAQISLKTKEQMYEDRTREEQSRNRH